MSLNEIYALLMVVLLISGVIIGYPVAWMLAGLGVIFGSLTMGFGRTAFQAALNTFGTMSGWELLAIPLFVYMGVVLEKADIAGRLFLGLRLMMGQVRGGLAIATMCIAILFAACTGIAGASVIAIGLIAMPPMLKYGYDKKLVSGLICAGGGLGVIIPPSIMLIVYGPVAGVSIALLFFAAIIPGFILGVMYVAYILIVCYIWPEKGPAITREERSEYTTKDVAKLLLVAGLPPLGLIVLVLGGIFFGFAAPTEAAALGSLGALIMTAAYGKMNPKMLKDTCYSALKISTFIMWLVLGAKYFMTTFNFLGGGALIDRWLMGLELGQGGMMIVLLSVIFIMGMFMDWIGILLVVVPIFVPIIQKLGWDQLWFAVMFCVTLQISYITPPFAYSIFYLKGIAPPEVGLKDIIKGCLPFIFLQFALLIFMYFWQDLILYIPRYMMSLK